MRVRGYARCAFLGDPQAEPADLSELLNQVVGEANSQDVAHIRKLESVEYTLARCARETLHFGLPCRNRCQVSGVGIAKTRNSLLESVSDEAGELRGAFIAQ